MYHFLFYFLYRSFSYSDEWEKKYTAIFFTFMIMMFHFFVILQALAFLSIIDRIPLFSNKYLINKLFWFIPLSIALIMFLLYFNNKRTSKIIQDYDSTSKFFNKRNVSLFLLMLIAPIILTAIIPIRPQ